MATPLIRIPQEQGGTMYAFSSAARDLTRAYYNPDVVFEYSKFALLDIPVVAEPTTGSTNNYIQFSNLYEGGPVSGGGVAPNYSDILPDDNANRHFAQTFQNYALNLENFILSDDDFDESIYASDSEKIFFKWLNHIGAFRTKPATSQEVINGISAVVEEDDSVQTGSEYSKVVKYLGNVDVSNDKNYAGDTYNEVFVNVPSYVGYTPTVLFKSSDYNTTDTLYQPTSEINGRAGQTHPDANIDLESLADNNDGTINIDPNNTYNYGIDWEESHYAKIASDKKLNNLLDYSKRGGDFRFNAIAVYYDVYSKSNPFNRSTNLYGVILLDNWKQDPGSTGWYMPELSKYKPNEVTGLNGNAFALKLNVKFNSSLDNVGIEKNINDYSTFSMDIFFDSTSALENAAKVLADATHSHNKLNTRLDDLENLFLTSVNTDNLTSKVSALEASIEDASLNYKNAGSVLDMISSTNKRLNQIINGEIPTEVQYNTDVIGAGQGISVDKTNNKKIKLHNSNYGYVLNEVHEYDYTSNTVLDKIDSSNQLNPNNFANRGIWTRIKGYENLVRIYLEQNTFSSNLNIYLDDSGTSFKLGQTIKLVFRTSIENLDNKAINIYTDKKNGWILKGTISTTDLLSNKPYVELICVDEINKTFELDIIR
jgi:hypothetical protein|tara:strand:- start:8300 stop:10258 length:1959 start_codon:yes stop_codon:yes gene_type:complete